MSDVAAAEQLWARAHEHVKRGDFAQAVRDLAQCFQILQAHNDPRVYEVHRRWTEVHQMYLEDGARETQAKPAVAEQASVEAEAEAAANAGDLDRAILLYEDARQKQPGNELVQERLDELIQARTRAHELTGPARAVAPAQPAQPAPAQPATPQPAQPAQPAHDAVTTIPGQAAAEDDWSDIAVDEPAPAHKNGASAPAVAAASAVVHDAPRATTAPTMKPDDAPVGMQSLDVPFSIGDSITADAADELPVEGARTTPPVAAAVPAVVSAIHAGAVGKDAQVALLNDLLGRVQKNRKKVA